jgi:pimeloyl-ACP methyl ester carboxylesterase
MEEFVRSNIEKVPYRCDYHRNNKRTVILLSGTGGDYADWNDTKPYEFFHSHILKDWKDGQQYVRLLKRGKLNFQKRLAQSGCNVLSYTPFEYINTVAEEQNKPYTRVEPSPYFFDMDQMCFTLKLLLFRLALKPPYTFVGFSEGGWRALVFADRFKNRSVDRCVLIDPQRHQKTTIENAATYSAYKLLTKATLKTAEDGVVFYKYQNLIRKYRLPKINRTPVTIFLNVVPERVVADAEFTHQINKSFVNTTWHIFLDQIHALHHLYFDDIIHSVITKPRV